MPQDELVAVCTIEKANGAINRLVSEGRLSELVCVVIDEAHMVGDPQRGLPLELALTKIVHAARLADAAAGEAGGVPAATGVRAGATAGAASSQNQAVAAAPLGRSCSPGVAAQPPRRSAAQLGLVPQLVCMSATMRGLDAMCAWLDARLFMTNFRPVALTEHAVFQGKIYGRRKAPAVAPALPGPADGGAVGTGGQDMPAEAVAAETVGTAAAASPARREESAVAATQPGTSGKGGSSPAAAAPAALSKGVGFSSAAALAAEADAAPLIELRDAPPSDKRDKDGVTGLVAEVVAEGHSCLVFCAGRVSTAVGSLAAESTQCVQQDSPFTGQQLGCTVKRRLLFSQQTCIVLVLCCCWS